MNSDSDFNRSLDANCFSQNTDMLVALLPFDYTSQECPWAISHEAWGFLLLSELQTTTTQRSQRTLADRKEGAVELVPPIEAV